MSWADNLIQRHKNENSEVVDNIRLGSVVSELRADDPDPVVGSTLDHVMTKALKSPLTLGELRRMNADIASAYEDAT